ncbi:MAG: ankyrin repeat domain-containing protein [Alphaproteobacteria bacterium]
MTKSLPSRPDIAWLKKTAKERLSEMRTHDASAKLYQAQLELAREYGFQSWRALAAHVESHSLDGEIIRAAAEGRASDLAKLLDEHPAKLAVSGGSFGRPLLHHAAEHGHLDCMRFLLDRGFAIDKRDKLDNASALHWAAQAGQLEAVRLLLDRGANPDGAGDEHEAGVIGWAMVLAGPRKEVAELLLARGASPTVFAAVALGREDLVRALAEAGPNIVDAQMSRHERRQAPLHFAVARNLPEMVRLLIELGADASAKDDHGATPLQYGSSRTDPRIAGMLIEAGADPALRGNYFESSTPQIEVKSIAASIDYFVQKLGFEKEWEAGNPASFACVFRDDVFIFLSSQHPQLGRTQIAISVRDVDALHEEYKARGATILQPPQSRPWGGRTIVVVDLDGNLLSIASQIATPEPGVLR